MSAELRDLLLRELSLGNFEQAARVADELKAKGDAQGYTMGRLILATRLHQGDELHALVASPEVELIRADPELHGFLALALRWTTGIQSAAEELVKACENPALVGKESIQQTVCAWASLAALSDDRELGHVDISRDCSIELLSNQILPIIFASLNGLAPEYFILDTGAPSSLLNRSYCERLGITLLNRPCRVATDSAGNEITLWGTIIDSIDMAGVTVRNGVMEVVELPPNFKIAGILSPLEVFRNALTELDLRDRVFRIYPATRIEEYIDRADERMHSTRLVWDNGNVFVQGTVNQNTKGWFLFDTGAGANFVSPQLAAAFGAGPRRPISTATAGGSAVFSPGFSGELVVGESMPVRAEFLVTDFHGDPDSLAPLICSGFVGIPWMLGRRIFFPPGGHQILFTDTASERDL